MDIVDMVGEAIGDIAPWYADTPEFAEGQAPERYIILNIAERGANYSEGVHRCVEYIVSLNVWTKYLDFTLYKKIKQAMSAAGFSYEGGGRVGDDKIYPYDTHYYLDFMGVVEE